MSIVSLKYWALISKRVNASLKLRRLEKLFRIKITIEKSIKYVRDIKVIIWKP